MFSLEGKAGLEKDGVVEGEGVRLLPVAAAPNSVAGGVQTSEATLGAS